jgi:hypothetical protein
MPGVDVDVAADMLWTLTSLRMWEDLVILRGWSGQKYEQRVYDLLLRSLTRNPDAK